MIALNLQVCASALFFVILFSYVISDSIQRFFCHFCPYYFLNEVEASMRLNIYVYVLMFIGINILSFYKYITLLTKSDVQFNN